MRLTPAEQQEVMRQARAIGLTGQKTLDAKTSLSEKILVKSIAEKEYQSVMETHQQAVEKTSDFPNKCTFCQKGFKKPSDLERHTRIHTGEKPYKCEVCQKSFSIKSTLSVHMRLHDGTAGNFAVNCAVCHAPFSSKTSLKSHMRLHTGAKPYVCPHCGLRFRTSAHRKTHIASDHTEQPNKKEKEPTNLTRQDETATSKEVSQQTEPKEPLQQTETAAVSTFIPLTIPAPSLIEALEAVRQAGEPLVGATVRLQLKAGPEVGGTGGTSLAHLTVDQVRSRLFCSSFLS